MAISVLVLGIVGLMTFPLFAPHGRSLAASGRFFPASVFGMLTLFSSLLLIKNYRTWKRGEGEKKKDDNGADVVQLRKVALPALVMIIYVLCLDYLGYIISSVMVLCTLMFMLRPPKSSIVKIALAAIVICMSVFMLFGLVLKVYLPKDFIGSFLYELAREL